MSIFLKIAAASATAPPGSRTILRQGIPLISDEYALFNSFETEKWVKLKNDMVTNFGIFVELVEGIDGLVHISEISTERTEDVNDVLEEGQEVEVKLIGFDRGKMKLSMKALAENASDSD